MTSHSASHRQMQRQDSGNRKRTIVASTRTGIHGEWNRNCRRDLKEGDEGRKVDGGKGERKEICSAGA